MRVPGDGQPGAPTRYVTYQAYREQGRIVGVARFAQEVTQQELGRQQVEQLNKGSGVGLYAIKRLLDNAGGKLEVESTLGVGSTFTAHLLLEV